MVITSHRTGTDDRRPAGPDDREQRRSRRLTLLATSLGFAVVQLDVGVANDAVKSIGAQLGGGVGALQWVVTAYRITFAAFILTAGALGDRIGARRVFVGGLCMFTLASAACGAAPALAVLVGARALQGVGAAVLVPASLSLLSHTFPQPGERARAVGLYLAGASLALAGVRRGRAGLIFVLSLLFQRELGCTPLTTGLALVPTMVAITAANLGAGPLSERLGPRRTVALGAVIMAAGCAGLVGVGRSSPHGALVAQIAALGLGGGFWCPWSPPRCLAALSAPARTSPPGR